MYPIMLLPPKTDIPSCMDLIAQELQEYMPRNSEGRGGKTIRVYDMHRKVHLDVHVVLTGLFADGPARDKL